MKKEEPNTFPQTIKKIHSELNLDDEFVANIFVVYERLHPTIKNLSIKKQIEITLSSLNIGLDSDSVAYKHISDIMKSDNVEEKRKKINNNKHGNLNLPPKTE